MVNKENETNHLSTEQLKEQNAKLQQELFLEKELVKKLKQTQEDWSDLIEKVQPTIKALSENIKELKSNLHLKNQELVNVLQSLSNGLIVTDLSGRIQTFNRAASSITGVKKQSALNSSINELFGVNIIPSQLNEQSLSDIDGGYPQQFSHIRDDGSETVIKSSTTLMRSDEEELQGIIINLVDITKIKRLEEEAERKNRMTAMGEIAMQVAHELRNPLGSIELFLSMMKMDIKPDSEEYSLAMHIGSATRSMNHIISNLLEYTKPRPIIPDTIDIHELLEEFIQFSEFSAEQLSIEIQPEFESKQHQILGNQELIKQVFHNLFVNACQAMPEGGVLKISTSVHFENDPLILKRLNSQFKLKDRELIKVSFEDNGKGMSEETKRKIFEPFFTTREQGTGLGLSIVHNSMVSHGGIITVSSQPDSGTIINLLFPIPDPEDQKLHQ